MQKSRFGLLTHSNSNTKNHSNIILVLYSYWFEKSFGCGFAFIDLCFAWCMRSVSFINVCTIRTWSLNKPHSITYTLEKNTLAWTIAWRARRQKRSRKKHTHTLSREGRGVGGLFVVVFWLHAAAACQSTRLYYNMMCTRDRTSACAARSARHVRLGGGV